MNDAARDNRNSTDEVKYNLLTFVREAPRDAQHRRRWVCVCDCGTVTTVGEYAAKSGAIKSCGCLRRKRRPGANKTHGMSKSAQYKRWADMIARCENQQHPAFNDYGRRGIRVCDRWEKFENFHADMGFPPSPSHSLDRKENNGNYEPENCRWATKKEQQRNTRFNRILTVNGVSKCVSAWAEEKGIPFNVIHDRLRLGWSDSKSVNTPYTPRP